MTGAHSLRKIIMQINMTKCSQVQSVQSDGILRYAWRMAREDGVHLLLGIRLCTTLATNCQASNKWSQHLCSEKLHW